MTNRSIGWLLAVLSLSLVLFGITYSYRTAPTYGGVVTMREKKQGERTCVLYLTDDLKRQAKEISVGLWERGNGEETVVTFVLPNRAEFDLAVVEIVVAEVPGVERERTAFISVEGMTKDNTRIRVSSTIGRFQYLGKNEYALGWTTERTVFSVGRNNIQSVGKYDGSDFNTGTEHNRLILYYEVK